MTAVFSFLFTIALIIGVANTMGTDMLNTFKGPPSANSSSAPVVISN
jgi:hypothetical protein